MDIDAFDWDEGNLTKCLGHGVPRAEIEDVLTSRRLVVFPDPEPGEVRLRAIGRTSSGRHVFLVYTLRQRGSLRLARPISARYMHRKEVEHYERQVSPSVRER